MCQVICKVPAEQFCREFQGISSQNIHNYEYAMPYFEEDGNPFVKVVYKFDYKHQAEAFVCPFERITPEIVINSFPNSLSETIAKFGASHQDISRVLFRKPEQVPYWVHLQQTKKPMRGKR